MRLLFKVSSSCCSTFRRGGGSGSTTSSSSSVVLLRTIGNMSKDIHLQPQYPQVSRIASYHHASRQLQQPSSSSSPSSTSPPPLKPMKYESHEYPWATEPPIITRQTAKEAAALAEATKMAAELKKDEATTEQVPTTATNATSSSSSSSSSTDTSTTASSMKTKDENTSSSSPLDVTSIWSMMTSFVTNLFSPNHTNNTTTSSSMSSFNSLSLHHDDASSSSKQMIIEDPFDDQQTLSAEQIETIRNQQRDDFQQLLLRTTTLLEPVTNVVPSYVPTISNPTTRPVPETIITTLDNGLRIVSQETYGHVSTIGIVSTMGSRYESASQTGVTNLMELLAFGTTDMYDNHQQVMQQLQEWLGTRFVHTGREQSMYGIDVLRPNVAQACEMMADVVLRPHWTNSELEHAHETMHYLMTHDELPQEFIMGEAINAAAFGMDQQLGKPHGCPVPQIPLMTRPIIQDWYQTHMIQNPHGLVFGGAGIDHDTLVRLGEQYFGHLQQQPPPPPTNNNNQNDPQVSSRIMIPSTYRGGSKVIALPAPIDGGDDLSPDQYSVVHREKRLTRVALGLEIGGWHSDNLVPICVLQSLLGGGSSFSAGGPGKGMYSRLYRQILNRYHWAESAEAFTSFHNEAGIMGITGRADAKYTTDMVKTFCVHLKRLAVEPVSEEELDRARNMLRNDVMTQLESRFVLFEDMARQVLTFGKREHVSETVAKIDAVTAEQIQAIVAKAIVQPPTFTAVGVDVQNVPAYEQVCEWLRR